MNWAIINGILAQLKNLAASWVTSGRFGKGRLEWTNNKLLKGAGATSDPTEIDVPAGANKEFFVPVTHGSDMGNTGYHTGALIDAAAEVASIEFVMPADFSSLVSDHVVGIVIAADEGVAYPMALTRRSQYGTLDEAYDAHGSAAAGGSVQDHSTLKDLISWTLDAVLGDLAAGDYVGIRVQHQVGNAGVMNETNCRILGVHIKYS